MDNVCHTLVGAALGRAGLERRSRLGTATLMIAANLPDLDVLVFATDTAAVEFRRGWTHGVVAQAVLPLIVTAGMVLIGRRGVSRSTDPPVRAGWLLLMAYLGVASHVFLDFLNTYGIRLLAPFDWGWFYGDALFIIDPWLWFMLGSGVLWSRRRRAAVPARLALGGGAVYIGAMLVLAQVSREIVLDAWYAEHGRIPVAAMVGPRAITPLERRVIIDAGDHYVTGTFTWWPTRVRFDEVGVPKNDGRSEVQQARLTPAFQAHLVWSRFPVYHIERVSEGSRVWLNDMRFVDVSMIRDTPGGGPFTIDTIVRDVQH